MPKKISELPRGIYQKGKYFHIQYTDYLGRRRREKAGTYKMAEDLLVARHIERLKRKIPGYQNRWGVKVSEIVDDAINFAYANGDEQSAYDLRLKLELIRKTFGERQAATITTQDVSNWLSAECAARGWKPASRNRYHSAFSMMFRVAIGNGKMETNPAKGIAKKQEDNGRVRYLSREEEDKLCKAIEEMDPRYVPLFILSLHTGMRLSEQQRMEPGDYDPQTGSLMVRQKKNRRGPSIRYVPLTPIALDAFKDIFENYSVKALETVSYWFDKCVDKAGIEDYSWHCNRHTFCSRLVMAGVPLAAVAQLAGHKNVQMTMRYSHLTPNAGLEAVAKMMSYYQK